MQALPRPFRNAGARAVEKHAAAPLREPRKQPRHKVCARDSPGKRRPQNARGAEIAHAVREHELRAVDRRGIRCVLPAAEHDLGVGRHDISAGAGTKQRVGTLFGFAERQRVERHAENVYLHTSENTLPIFSRMRRSADSSYPVAPMFTSASL